MKKARFLAVILSFALVLTAGVSVAAFADEGSGEEFTVTYSLTAYQDRTEKVALGGKVNAPVIGDFYRSWTGWGSNGIGEGGIPASEALAIEWYSDADYSTPYNSDVAVNSDMHLYGRIVEKGNYGKSDVYGWNALSGTVYVGNPALNQVLSSDSLCNPTSIEDDGSAFFSFSSGDYSILHCGFDVTQPFTVKLQFADFGSDYFSDTIIPYNVALYASVYEAMVGTVYGHEERGAMASATFYLGSSEHVGRIHNAGYYAAESSPRVVWNDTAANQGEPISEKMKSILEESDGELEFTFHILESGSYAEINGERLLELGCVRKNFPKGVAYLSTGTVVALEATVSVSQEVGSIRTTEGLHVKNSSAALKGSYLEVAASVDKGYALKANVYGIEVQVEKLPNGKYAVGLPYFSPDEITVDMYTQKTGGGCNSSLAAGCLPAAIALILAGVAVVLIRRKRKGEN